MGCFAQGATSEAIIILRDCSRAGASQIEKMQTHGNRGKGGCGGHRLKRMRPKKVSMSRSRRAAAKEAGAGASPAGRCSKLFSLRVCEQIECRAVCGFKLSTPGVSREKRQGGNESQGPKRHSRVRIGHIRPCLQCHDSSAAACCIVRRYVGSRAVELFHVVGIGLEDVIAGGEGSIPLGRHLIIVASQPLVSTSTSVSHTPAATYALQ